MTVYNVGEIYLEDLSGGTSDQLHIYAQTGNIADGAVTDAKLASTGIKSTISGINAGITARDKVIYNSVHYGNSVLSNSGYITATGGVGLNNSFGYSDLIEIPNGAKSVTINRHGAFTGSAVAFYSDAIISASAFVSGTPSPGDVAMYEDPIDANIPDGASYLAFSGRTDSVYYFDAQINFDFLDISDDIKNLQKNVPYFGADTTIENADLVTAGKYIKTDGAQASNNAFACSEMYELPADASDILIVASGNIPTGCAVAFYYWSDFSAGAFISGVSVPSDIPSADQITVQIPDGARYVAFSGRTADTFLATIRIKTVADFLEHKRHQGEYLSILGDSISTYDGYIPSDNQYYYPQTYLPDVNCTWWKRLLDETGMTLLVNNSWSGSLMSGTSQSVGLNRCENLDDGTHMPDHIIVFMGVNDFKYPRALGECGLNSDTYSDLNFSDAYYTALNRIRTKYPRARLYLGTIMQFNYPNDNVTGFPIINSDDVNLTAYNDAIRKLADLYGAEVIEFTKCGITYFNRSVTLGDTAGMHPNAVGHYLMFEAALSHFE